MRDSVRQDIKMLCPLRTEGREANIQKGQAPLRQVQSSCRTTEKKLFLVFGQLPTQWSRRGVKKLAPALNLILYELDNQCKMEKV